MDAEAEADVFRTVEYSRDRWTMKRVPLGLLGCLAGLVFIVYMGPIKATAQTTQPGAVGWIGVGIGLGWIAYALARHVRPARPFLMLSPAGISLHLPWVKNVLIPWHEVQDIGLLEWMGGSGPARYQPDTTAVTVSREFYERHIVPERRLVPNDIWLLDFIRGSHVRGTGWEEMFQSKDLRIQVMLPFYLWFCIEPKDIREPVEARWKAFRDRHKRGTSVPTTKAESARGPALVYGAWSPKLTPWQAAQFIVPIVGIVAILMDAVGVWR